MKPHTEAGLPRATNPRSLGIAAQLTVGILAGLISNRNSAIAAPVGGALTTPSLPAPTAPAAPRAVAGDLDDSGRDPGLAERLRRLGSGLGAATKLGVVERNAGTNEALSTGVDVVVQPTVQATTTAPLLSSPIANLVDQSGLSPAYANRFTGFGPYVVAATHASFIGPAQQYYQFTPSTGGTIDFNLGSLTTIDRAALWQVANNGGQLKTVTLTADDNAAFSSPTVLGTFALVFEAAEPAPAQVFTFPSTEAQYVRLTVVENFGFAGASILGEIAFSGALPAPAYNDRFGQQVAGTLNIHWEVVSAPPGVLPGCSGIEFTNGTFGDAADGTVSMSGIGVTNGLCIGLDNYTLTMAPDGLSLSGFAGAVPMTLIRTPRDACFVGDWVGSGFVYRAHIAADPFPAPAFDPSNVGEWSGWAQTGGVDRAASLSITGQVWNGSSWQITGAFDWKCLFGAECSGHELVQGTITSAGVVHLVGTSLVNGENLTLGVYDGQRSSDGRTITGTFAGGTWVVSRVSAYAVPSEVASIQDAVDFFPNRPALRVEVEAGTHAENLDLAPLAASPGAVEIIGLGLPGQTIIDDGLPSVRPPIVTTNGAASLHPVTLRNLTVTGGRVEDLVGGAGIRVVGGSTRFVVEDCIVRNNANTQPGAFGGGVSLSPTDRVRIDNCLITQNSAPQQAGGIFAEGTLVLTKSTVSSNAATQGAGVVATGTATITQCDILNHQTNTGPAGVWIESGATAVVDNCAFSGNVAEFGPGGALYVRDTDVQVTNSTFVGNGAERGGAIAAFYSTLPVSIRDCTLTGNTAGIGGAIYTQARGRIDVLRSTFENNSAAAGGGYDGLDSDLLFTDSFVDCDFIGNVATGDAGAVGLLRRTVTFINCRFFDNEARGVPYPQSNPPYGGGAIQTVEVPGFASPAGVRLVNCAVVNNRGLGSDPMDGGGGIFQIGGNLNEVSNTIIWGNSASVGSVEAQQIMLHSLAGQSPASAILRHVIVKGLSPTTALGPGPLWGDDPLFVNEAAGNLRLTGASPALDAGNSALLPAGTTTDLDGTARIIGASVDLGPYEFDSLTGVSGAEDGIPRAPGIATAYPNPFNPRTTIAFALTREGRVQIAVYNVRGARVRRLVDEALAPGAHRAAWDGTDDAGRRVAGGTYTIRLEALGIVDELNVSLVK